MFVVDTAICALQLQCCYSDVKMLIMDIWSVIQMDEVKPAPNFSAAPLCDFGDPHGPDWFIDASSAAKWSASYGKQRNKLSANKLVLPRMTLYLIQVTQQDY
jgi:hypothetical protein